MVKTPKFGGKRKKYLDLLLHNVAAGKDLALVGPVHIGKSTILKQFKTESKDVVVHIDLERIGLSPDSFALHVIDHACLAFYGKKARDCKLGETSSSVFARVQLELEKIKPNHRLLVEQAVGFIDALGKEVGKQAVVCLDEFWKLLDMNNFGQIRDVLELFKQITSSHPTLRFIIAGSAVVLMKDLASKLKYDVVEVEPLKAPEVGDEVGYYSQGVPLYANAIASGNVRVNFLRQVLWKQGTIYQSCLQKLQSSLSRARGRALLFNVLEALCSTNGLRLSEISQRIYRPSSVTKNLLSRLISVDLVVQEGNLYKFNDAILQFWFRHYVANEDFDFEPDDAMLKKFEVDI